MEILILEDDESVNRGISFSLEKEGYGVFSCKNIKEAKKVLEKENPDIFICDINLPDGNGLEFCRKIRNKSKVFVLFLTAMDSEIDMVNGYDAGADDYITKPFNILEVKARIKAIMRRTSPARQQAAQASVIEKGDLKLDCESRRLFINGTEINLTTREFELLEIMVKNENKVYSRENLLNLVWGKEYPGDVRTVDVHVRRLREKIETNPSEPKYVHTKWGVGYYYNQK